MRENGEREEIQKRKTEREERGERDDIEDRDARGEMGERERSDGRGERRCERRETVSYTHLTLPTKRIV